MNDIKVPPFTKGQQELIKMTEKLANGRKICDVDDIDDDIKDIKITRRNTMNLIQKMVNTLKLLPWSMKKVTIITFLKQSYWNMLRVERLIMYSTWY